MCKVAFGMAIELIDELHGETFYFWRDYPTQGSLDVTRMRKKLSLCTYRLETAIDILKHMPRGELDVGQTMFFMPPSARLGVAWVSSQARPLNAESVERCDWNTMETWSSWRARRWTSKGPARPATQRTLDDRFRSVQVLLTCPMRSSALGLIGRCTDSVLALAVPQASAERRCPARARLGSGRNPGPSPSSS